MEYLQDLIVPQNVKNFVQYQKIIEKQIRDINDKFSKIHYKIEECHKRIDKYNKKLENIYQFLLGLILKNQSLSTMNSNLINLRR